MNGLMRRMMDDIMPKFNPDVVNGSVPKILETTPGYLDSVFASSIKPVTDTLGLEYLGYTYVTPEQEFTKRYANTGNNVCYDLAKSNLYPLRFMFKYRGEYIEKDILLPYASKGNLFTMFGTTYTIAPVLSDTVLSPDYDQVFVRLLKDKITFKSYNRNFVYNNEARNGSIIWSEIMKNSPKNGLLGKPLCGVSLYLFGKYGFKEVINRYFKKDIEESGVLDRPFRDDDILFTEEELPELRETHNVYESSKTIPQKCRSLSTYYIGHNAKFYVHKDIKETTFIKNCIYGVINGLDVLPHEVSDLMHHIHNNELDNELFKWKMIISTIASKGNYSISRRMEDIVEHFNSLEYYIDNIIKDSLGEINIHIENFFDLVYVILKRYDDLVLSAKEYNSDINNRYIDVNYYICYDIMIAFNKFILSINKRRQKLNNTKMYGQSSELYSKEIKKSEIEQMLNKELDKKIIYAIVKSSTPNFNIKPVDYTGDNAYYKGASLLEDQSLGNGVKRAPQQRMPASMKNIRGMDMMIGCLFFLNKTLPCPRTRLNPFFKYNIYNGRIILSPREAGLLTWVDNSLKGKLNSDDVTFDYDFEDDGDTDDVYSSDVE